MKVLELMDEILDEIRDSRKGVFAQKKSIDADFVLEILEEIKAALPDEIAAAQQIVEREQQIIYDAQEKGKEILEGVNDRMNAMLDEHRITQLAYEKANRFLDSTEKQAYEIRANANDYAVTVLDDLSSYMREYQDIIQENKSNFLNKKNKDQAEF